MTTGKEGGRIYTVVLHHRQPGEALKAAVMAGGAQLLVLNVDGAEPVTELETNVDQVIKALTLD